MPQLWQPLSNFQHRISSNKTLIGVASTEAVYAKKPLRRVRNIVFGFKLEIPSLFIRPFEESEVPAMVELFADWRIHRYADKASLYRNRWPVNG